MTDPTNNADNPMAMLFATGVVIVATGLLWLGKINGGDWVTTVTWVTAALLLGRAASAAASGYVVSAQARMQTTLQAGSER